MAQDVLADDHQPMLGICVSGRQLALAAALITTVAAATPTSARSRPASSLFTSLVTYETGGGQSDPPAAPSEREEHGLPQKAVEIARPFGFPITNSMIVTWLVAVGLIVFAQASTRRMH